MPKPNYQFEKRKKDMEKKAKKEEKRLRKLDSKNNPVTTATVDENGNIVLDAAPPS